MEKEVTAIDAAPPLFTPADSEQVSLDGKARGFEATEAVEGVDASRDDLPKPEPGGLDVEANVPELSTDDTIRGVTTEHHLERWNEPRNNIYRYLVALLGFIIMGMHDACFGALIPYMEPYYGINHTVVSILFIVPVTGYVSAAMLNNKIHHKFGQRGIAILGPTTRLVGYISAALHPPFPALPILLIFAAFGNGVEDAAWNAWIGNMHHASELLGILHGFYGFGATIGPLLSTTLVTQGNRPWFSFFYIMVGLTGLELVVATTTFWPMTGAVYRETHKMAKGQKRTTTRKVLRGGIPWLLAMVLLGIVAIEVCLGGWATTFMLRNRDAEPFIAGFTVTAFFIGITLGRFVGGFVTVKLGEKLGVYLYLLAAIAFELLFWFVPNIAASVVFSTVMGFFVGPLFPVAIVAVTKLLPVDYHISAIGFAASSATGGAAIVPFAVGAIAEHNGVWVMHPALLATLIFIFLVWLALPGGLRPGSLERARQSHEPVGKHVRNALRWLREKLDKK